jgi:hypothetical protein
VPFVPGAARLFGLDKTEIYALLRWLFGEPVIEHGPREANVPPHPMAGQPTSPHSLVDPARLDVEIPSRPLRALKSIFRQGGRGLCCCLWSLHTPYRPRATQTGQWTCLARRRRGTAVSPAGDSSR